MPAHPLRTLLAELVAAELQTQARLAAQTTALREQTAELRETRRLVGTLVAELPVLQQASHDEHVRGALRKETARVRKACAAAGAESYQRSRS